METVEASAGRRRAGKQQHACRKRGPRRRFTLCAMQRLLPAGDAPARASRYGSSPRGGHEAGHNLPHTHHVVRRDEPRQHAGQHLHEGTPPFTTVHRAARRCWRGTHSPRLRAPEAELPRTVVWWQAVSCAAGSAREREARSENCGRCPSRVQERRHAALTDTATDIRPDARRMRDPTAVERGIGEARRGRPPLWLQLCSQWVANSAAAAGCHPPSCQWRRPLAPSTVNRGHEEEPRLPQLTTATAALQSIRRCHSAAEARRLPLAAAVALQGVSGGARRATPPPRPAAAPAPADFYRRGRTARTALVCRRRGPSASGPRPHLTAW
jgi:hypothetical protein